MPRTLGRYIGARDACVPGMLVRVLGDYISMGLLSLRRMGDKERGKGGEGREKFQVDK